MRVDTCTCIALHMCLFILVRTLLEIYSQQLSPWSIISHEDMPSFSFCSTKSSCLSDSSHSLTRSFLATPHVWRSPFGAAYTSPTVSELAMEHQAILDFVCTANFTWHDALQAYLYCCKQQTFLLFKGWGYSPVLPVSCHMSRSLHLCVTGGYLG